MNRRIPTLQRVRAPRRVLSDSPLRGFSGPVLQPSLQGNGSSAVNGPGSSPGPPIR